MEKENLSERLESAIARFDENLSLIKELVKELDNAQTNSEKAIDKDE